MTDSSQPGFLEALRAVIRALDDLDAPSMIIGGVAVIASGVPRYTADIDLTVEGKSSDPEGVFGAFARHGIVPRIEGALEFARSRQVILAVHEPSGISIDASLAWLPFEEEAIDSSQERDYAGVSIRIPRPEDLLIYKLVASRPQDLEDAEKLLLLYGKQIDLSRVRGLIREFSDALEDMTRVDTLERLVQKILPSR